MLTLENKFTVVKEVAASVAPEIRKRIHVNGKDSLGNNIGKYSKSYFKYVRPKYNRTEPIGKKVMSLTRGMENSFTSGFLNQKPTKTNLGYGIGFINESYYEIAMAQEKKLGKKIWSLTNKELKLAYKVANNATKEILKSK